MYGDCGIVTGFGDVAGDDDFVEDAVNGKWVAFGDPGVTCGEGRTELISDPLPISDPPPITDPLGSSTSSVPFAYTNLT